jgi:hypothetical protein
MTGRYGPKETRGYRRIFSTCGLVLFRLMERRRIFGERAADVDRARATYRETRQIWFADGILDAHERLAVITVAAGLRHFAFLNHLAQQPRKMGSELLFRCGFQTGVFSARFDLDFKVSGVSTASLDAYKTFKIRNERFFGLGVWSSSGQGPPSQAITISNLGSALGYPECCVRMDVQTKRQDHQLFLRALVKDVGDRPDQVTWALRRRYAVTKASQSYLRQWQRRFELTLARFPFALHTACDGCLKDSSSPTAVLSASYERLAEDVSEELHFLIRWASRIGGRDR